MEVLVRIHAQHPTGASRGAATVAEGRSALVDVCLGIAFSSVEKSEDLENILASAGVNTLCLVDWILVVVTLVGVVEAFAFSGFSPLSAQETTKDHKQQEYRND